MNVHNNFGQKSVELEFLILIFLWIFNYKKLGILEIFGHRLPQFSSDLSNFWLECAQQYCPQNCGTRILIFFTSNFFLLISNYKKRSKLEILQVFGHFLRKFSMGAHETWFTGMLWVFLSVCEKWVLWAEFLAPEFWRFWAIFSKKNWCQTLTLGLQAYCRCFPVCVWKSTLAGQIFGPK